MNPFISYYLNPLGLGNSSDKLRTAETYAQWAELAREYDNEHGLEEWKQDESSDLYDPIFIRERLEQIRSLLDQRDYQQLMFVLNVDIPFYGRNVCRPALYGKARFGTKYLIHDYIQTVCGALETLVKVNGSAIPPVEKTNFFRRVSRSCGHSALMLSGGAVLGFFHAGVLRALFDQDLLPRVLSGSSAGAILAAVVCTHSDDELRDRLSLDNLHQEAEKTCVIRPEVSLLENENTMVDAERLRCYLDNIIPDMTFQEAYDATGRSLNITVTGLKPQQESLLLNPISAPNVYIRSAVMASCAIYGIYPPVTLEGKDAAGERIEYLPHLKWIDGSFVDDLPAKRLARLYGINHFISSMANPAALAFTPNPDIDSSFFMKAFNFHQNLFKKITSESLKFSRDYLRIKSPAISLLQHLSYSVLSQEYTSDINIFLPNRWDHPVRLLDAPTREEMQRLIREGELATWEKIEMVRDCTGISRTLEGILRTRVWNQD